jgi:ketosteroid isomerase-like protein
MPDLPSIVQSYIDASNAHDVKSIVSCFSADAVVRDEKATHRGKIDIERWITTTIEKYNFKFEPLSAKTRDGDTVVSVVVSGTFPGSPVTLDYHFVIDGGKISLLAIDS